MYLKKILLSYIEQVSDLDTTIQKEENSISNPDLAKTEKSPLSEPSLENKKTSGVISKSKRPSVRKALKEIKEELKLKETKDEVKEKLEKTIPTKKKTCLYLALARLKTSLFRD